MVLHLDRISSLIDSSPKGDYYIMQILNLLTNTENNHNTIGIHEYKKVQGKDVYIGISKINIARLLHKETISKEIGNIIDRLEVQKLVISDKKKKSNTGKFFRVTENGKFAFLELQKLFEKKEKHTIDKFLYCCQDVDKNLANYRNQKINF